MHGTRDEAAVVTPPFEIVLRGFHRQQVMDHLNALKTRVGTIAVERDAALQRAGDLNEQVDQLRLEVAEAATELERLRREAAEAATEIDRLARSPLTAGTARIQQMLQIAEDEAAELQAATEHETTALREKTRAETDRLMTETRQQCERLDAESSSRRRAVEAESEARQQRLKQQLERNIARRESETDAWIRDYQTHSVAALYLLMQLAGERLSSRVATVRQQVNAAKQLRSVVTDQLSELHRLLADALGVADQRSGAEHADDAANAGDRAAGSPEAGSDDEAGSDERGFDEAEFDEAEFDEFRPESAPALEPAVAAGGSTGPGAPPQGTPLSSAGRPRQPAESTAQFGLHP